MSVFVDHFAVLTPTLDGPLATIAAWGLVPGPVEAFPAEGTREVYVGPADAPGRLLLMAPHGETGPYARALAKRGPGLHHVGLAVGDLEAFVAGLAGRGWLLLPQSLATVREARTAWLARPGVPLLIEAAEGARPRGGDALITRLEVPMPANRADMLAALGARALAPSPDGGAWLTIAGRREPVARLLAADPG